LPWLFGGEVVPQQPPPGIAPASDRKRLLDLAAVRLTMSVAGARVQNLDGFLRDTGWERRSFDQGGFTLFENPHALPRAFVTYRTRPAPETPTLLAALSRAEFDPLVESYVEGGPALDPAAEAPRGEAAHVVADEEAAVEVEAALSRPGIVVLADAFYPGWRATVDGTPAAIFPANHLFRGVAVPAGRHRVRFEYHPVSVAAGAAASVLGCLAIGFLAVRAIRKGKRFDSARAGSGASGVAAEVQP
jgi:hypothetical protein